MPQNLDPTDTTKFCACFAKHLEIAIPGEKVEEIRIQYMLHGRKILKRGGKARKGVRRTSTKC